MKPYQYEHLRGKRAIRVLELYPGAEDSPLDCHLQAYRHYRLASYEAISYCWGADMLKEELICDGKVLKISKNLAGALRRFRSVRSPRVLWADAVCIDQPNLDEKRDQVAVMREIYKHARGVLVWLGQSDGETELALSLMRQLAALPWPPVVVKVTNQHILVFDHKSGRELANLPPYSDPHWKALIRFFDRPWFRRTWVIQEVAECSRISALCGGHQIDWQILRHVMKWIMDYLNKSNAGKHLFGRSLWRAGFICLPEQKLIAGDVPFLQLLHVVRSFEATNLRDKIFAMLSLPIGLYSSRFRTYMRYYASYVSVYYNANPNARQGIVSAISIYSGLFIAGVVLMIQSLYSKKSIERISLRIASAIAIGMGILFFTTLLLLEKGSRIIPASATLEIKPDYEKATKDIYRDFAIAVIKHYRHLDVLSYVQYSPQDIKDQDMRDQNMRDQMRDQGITIDEEYIRAESIRALPSWVPNWASSDSGRILLTPYLHPPFLRPFPRSYSAAGNTKVSAEFYDRKNEIRLGGVRVDSIATMQDVLNREDSDDICLINLLKKWSASTEPYRTGEDLLTACLLTLVADRSTKDLYPAHSDIPRLYKDFRVWLAQYANVEVDQLFLRLETTNPLPDEARVSEGGFHLADVLLGQYPPRGFFTTREGYIGICTLAAQPGDIVCVLFGGHTPFVLRAEDDHYILVGECYVHGLMDGEAISDWKKGKLVEKTFNVW